MFSPKKIFLILIALIIVAGLGYVAIGNFVIRKIDDDVTFSATPPEGGSFAIAAAAALMQRELDYGWRPSDRFSPGVVLRDNPAFQMGIKQAIERFVMLAVDQLARERGTSTQDKDLLNARARIQFKPDVAAVFNSQSSFENYQIAVKSLNAFNQRLGENRRGITTQGVEMAVYDLRSDNLIRTIEGVLSDLGDSITNAEIKADEGAVFFAARGDYFHVKGLLYGECILLSGLEKDFESVLKEREALPIFEKALSSTCKAAQYKPILVINDAADGLLPSHLLNLAGAASLARAQWHELRDVLQNRPS